MIERYCPIPLIGVSGLSYNQKCGREECQMWDKKHKDCGLKTKYRGD